MKTKDFIKQEKREIERFLGVNPFVKHLVIPINNITLKNQFKFTGETDKEGNKLVDTITVKAEATGFTKLYITAENRKLISLITQRSKDLLLWIMYELEAGFDYVEINSKRYMKEAGIKSVNTYKEAIKDLIRYDIIARTRDDKVFWINPEYLFRGDRIKKFPNKVSIKEKKNDEEKHPSDDTEMLNKNRPSEHYEKAN